MEGIKHLVCMDMSLAQMTDEVADSWLDQLSMEQANEQLFDWKWKHRWCEVQNRKDCIRGYFVKNGIITRTDPAGWYY